MPRLLFSQNSQPLGPLLIGFGLVIVLAAQIFPAIPIASAMMLIGWGATLILGSGSLRSQLLLVINLLIYATLICFAISAQSHAALNGPSRRIDLLLWADHGAALLLLLLTIKWVMGRIGSPTAFDQ